MFKVGDEVRVNSNSFMKLYKYGVITYVSQYGDWPYYVNFDFAPQLITTVADSFEDNTVLGQLAFDGGATPFSVREIDLVC